MMVAEHELEDISIGGKPLESREPSSDDLDTRGMCPMYCVSHKRGNGSNLGSHSRPNIERRSGPLIWSQESMADKLVGP